MCRITLQALSLPTVLLVGCASLQDYSTLKQPLDTTLTVNVGETIFRLKKTRDLPNALGKADLFGRTVDAGYQELRFVGMDGESVVLFAFRDVEVFSNETTMSRSGVGFLNIRSVGSTTTGTITRPPSSTTQVLAPYEVMIRHDIRGGSNFAHSGVQITILKAGQNELVYSLSR